MKKFGILFLAALVVLLFASCDNSSKEPGEDAILNITAFTDENYKVMTDEYYRGGSGDSRTITGGKLDLASGGLGFYFGTADAITFKVNGKTYTENYKNVVKAGDKYEMTVTISGYEGLAIGGNAFSSESTVTPDAKGLITGLNGDNKTFSVLMTVLDNGVSYAIGEDVKTITVENLKENEEVRYGFTFWAKKGMVESVKIVKK